MSTDETPGITTESKLIAACFSTDDQFTFYHSLASTFSSEIDYHNTTLDLLEHQVAKNNQDKFIDLSYTY